MPRTARLVVPNYVHHITSRGNYYQNIFQDDEDRLHLGMGSCFLMLQ